MEADLIVSRHEYITDDGNTPYEFAHFILCTTYMIDENLFFLWTQPIHHMIAKLFPSIFPNFTPTMLTALWRCCFWNIFPNSAPPYLTAFAEGGHEQEPPRLKSMGGELRWVFFFFFNFLKKIWVISFLADK